RQRNLLPHRAQGAEGRRRRRRRPDHRPADPAPERPREERVDAAVAVAVSITRRTIPEGVAAAEPSQPSEYRGATWDGPAVAPPREESRPPFDLAMLES